MRRVSPGVGSPRAVLLWVLIGVGVAACNLSPYTLGGDDEDGPDAALHDGGVLDGRGNGDGGGPTDAMPDACSPFPERCNLVDDDCNGNTDEGFDLTQDPANCGACGMRCAQPNAAGTCTSGECAYACLPGFVDTDGNVNDGCEYLCTVTNGGIEVCDEADNDCDQAFDEDLGLDTDVLNCGSCGNRCVALNAPATCAASTCGFGTCELGYADITAAIVGCEYDCPVFPPTIETCDGVDENCDGTVDELPIAGLGGTCTDAGFGAIGETGACAFGVEACSFGVEVCQGYTRPRTEVCDDSAVGDLADEDCDGVIDDGFDKANDPRHCGSCAACDVDFAIPGCAVGACTVAACLPGHVDEDGDPDNGCEYACTLTGPETCDGRDNDCDGDIDLDDPDLVAPPPFCNDNGACGGTMPTCAADTCGGPVTWTCDYTPSFVLAASPGGATASGTTATFTTTSAHGLVVGATVVVAGVNVAGYNGTWTVASLTSTTKFTATVSTAGLGGGGGGTVVDGTVEVDACGDLPVQEVRCDNLDGDCDNAIDENFPDKGDVCDDGGVGLCQGSGELRCDAAQTAVECVITTPGQTSTAEVCDNLDQNCNGIIDDGAPDEMVPVTSGATTYYVYKYEASRPDASGGTFGSAEHRSCSKPTVLPWRSVTHTEAAAACAASGKRLCTAAEWQLSCEGPTGLEFPYGDTYQPTACNGRDVDLDCTAPDSDQVSTTGRAYGDTNPGLAGCQAPASSACVSPSRALDLSGNLREWTSTAIGTSAFRVKGGAFDNIEQGLSCDFSFLAFAPSVELPNLGFRCCSDTP